MIWRGETGKYHCKLEFPEKGITEERDCWLFKDETMGVHIIEVGEMIPGTAKKDWTKTDRPKPYEDLFNAIIEGAVVDIRTSNKWVEDYPIKHNRLHCKARSYYEFRKLKSVLMEKDYAEGFLKNSYIGKRIKDEQRREGRDYDIKAILETGIQTERENTGNA